jgi:hypothetical protein
VSHQHRLWNGPNNVRAERQAAAERAMGRSMDLDEIPRVPSADPRPHVIDAMIARSSFRTPEALAIRRGDQAAIARMTARDFGPRKRRP